MAARPKVGVLLTQLGVVGGGQVHAIEIAHVLRRIADVTLLHAGTCSLDEVKTLWGDIVADLAIVRLPSASDSDISTASASFDLVVNCSTRLPTLQSRYTAIMVYFPFKVNLTARGLLRRRVGHVLKPFRGLLSARLQHLMDSLPSHAEIATVRRYDIVLANSTYTRYWIKQFWQRDSDVCTPLVRPIAPGSTRHQEVIHVGRFFDYFGHNKRQHVLIEVFRQLVDDGLKGWHLRLVGGLADRAQDVAYHRKLESMAQGYPISLHPNAARPELDRWLGEAAIYWHASGFGADLRTNPMDVEHFGISTVEAMSAGCVPVVINLGGQPEIVTPESGFLWNTLAELKAHTLDLIQDGARMLRMRNAAMARATVFCDRDAFASNVLRALSFRGMETLRQK